MICDTLVNSVGPVTPAGSDRWWRQVVGGDEWLTVAEAVQKLRDAGYPESYQTVRRLADAGRLESYRTETGSHRRIKGESVQALIRARQGEPGDGLVPPETPPAG